MISLLLVAFLLVPLSVQAQPADTTDAPPPSTAATTNQESADWLLLPFVSYAPRTKLSGGGTVGYYRPSSNVEAVFEVTQREQLTIQLSPELYLDGGRWRVEGELRATHFPDSFYGIGGDTPIEAEEEYTARYLQVDGRAQRRIRPNFRVGPRVFVRTGTVDPDSSGGLLAQRRVAGATGGQTIGLGASAFWDARNSLYYPTKGTYAEVEGTLYSALWESDYTYGHLRTDFRGYRPLGIGVLAGQVVTSAVLGSAPFQRLPELGGSNQMRGYRGGRFRDDVYWTVQAEYRFPLFWRFKGTTFASAGEVGPRIGSSLFGGVEAAVGMGGRLRFTEDGVHGRLDVAYSRTGIELYLSLGEAF